MDATQIIVVTVLAGSPFLAILLAVLWWRARSRAKAIENKYAGIDDVQAHTRRLQEEAAAAEASISKLKADYAEKHTYLDKLKQMVAAYNEKTSFYDVGLYEPHFEFDDPEDFKAEILKVSDEQKRMVSAKTAVTCSVDWQVDGSRAAGKKMADRNVRLTLRAFNGECDAAISNVRWNNAKAMEKRIETAFNQISKLNETTHVHISSEYLALKLKELRLTHEYRERLKREKEERAEAARLSREEQKLIRDLEKAEEEEAHYQRLLAKAKAEAQAFTGEKLAVFQEQIRTLESDLAEAHAKVERAMSMAERTRTGYVYIISNVGSFGDGVVKIGLTRRLDPSDRVRELGDASVPFIFDTHAIIYSDDAPALERALHAEFEHGRVNTSNFRKEFFRVSLDEVEAAVRRLAPGAPFIKDIEAQEFQETLARRHAMLVSAGVVAEEVEDLPAAI